MIPTVSRSRVRASGDAQSGPGDPSAPPSHLWTHLATVAFLAAGGLLVASALFLNLFLSDLGDARDLAMRASSLLLATAELHVEVRAAETGQRGYLLTGERRYQAPYDEAVGRVWGTFQTIEQTVRDPAQVVRLRQLRPLLQAKLEELAHTVELRGHSFEDALAVVRTDVGQKLMEEIDRAIADFDRAEQDLLISSTRHMEQQAYWTTRVAELTGILALLSAVLGVLWRTRQRAGLRLLDAERRFRRDLEHLVEERTAQLTQANRELDAFAYTISHDLRAPLRAMHGYADALEEDYGTLLPEEGRRFAERIVSAAGRMDDLIQDILAYSRLAREEVSVRPVALETIVDKVVAESEPLVAQTGAAVEIVRPLPVAMAHPQTLAQAIENLLSNAIKFAPPGQKPRVRIGARILEGRVRLEVEDEGIGIDPAHQERVFQPFQRLHGVEAYPGTGIGLAIVRRSVERMGGRCGVESALGQGSRFWIELDAAPQEDPA